MLRDFAFHYDHKDEVNMVTLSFGDIAGFKTVMSACTTICIHFYTYDVKFLILLYVNNSINILFDVIADQSEVLALI